MNPADPSARSPCVGVPQRPVRPLSISPLLSSLEVSSSRPSLGVQTRIPFCSLTRAVGISPSTSPNPTVPPRPLPPPRPSSFLLTSGRPSTHSRGPNTQRRPRPPTPFPHPLAGLTRSLFKAPVTCSTSPPLVQGCKAFSSARAAAAKRCGLGGSNSRCMFSWFWRLGSPGSRRRSVRFLMGPPPGLQTATS